MNHFKLICIDCNAAHKPSFELLRCSKCDGILDVEYSYSYIKEIRQNLSVNTLIELMTPVTEKESIVSLGEGNTPCTAISTVSSDFNQTLIAKLEYMNPTGSFKDRGVATMISAAKHYGIKEIVEDSSGNAGASVAAYGAAAGIKSNIFVPSDAAGSKLAQISSYGAVVHKINGSRSDVTEISLREGGIEGGISKFAQKNVPILHVLNIKSLTEQLGMPFAPIPIPEIGSGSLYAEERYNIFVSAVCLIVVCSLVFAVGYHSKQKFKEHLVAHEPDC